jgi:hypothetical protein
MMKVPPEIRSAHQRQTELNEHLRDDVREIIEGFIPDDWHYVGRLKGLESFALKVESGRFDDPMAIEDFFACTIVVRNSTELPLAERLIRENFVVSSRRPPDPNRTHKSPDAFPFDDIRFYAHLAARPMLPANDWDSIIFEIQVKTFLQHAWAIATHDLVYKSNKVSWARARIAYQIKATLEHAEVAIEEADNIAGSSRLRLSDGRTAELVDVINVVKRTWPAERLPHDLRRVAENILFAFRCFGVGPQRFEEIIEAATEAGKGASLLDLSPYAATLQALLDCEKAGFEKFLTKGTRAKLFVPRGIEPPGGLAWPPAATHVTIL